MSSKPIIYQFHISLKDIDPQVWRRIQVPQKYSFWDLHVAIQDSMGWLDYHLHQFTIKKPFGRGSDLIGIPDDELFEDDPEILPGWDIPIERYFKHPYDKADYLYDFGDNWEHNIFLEGILVREKNQKYPRCMNGKRACPPEDCGGTDGYHNVLHIISNPSHVEYEDTLTWLGGKYDPEQFEPKKVKFANPRTRWKKAFQNTEYI